MTETLDPRTPVLVGAGQLSNRVDQGATPLEPVDLMAESLRKAADDAGSTALLGAIDDVRALATLSWRYQDPGTLVAQRIGARAQRTVCTVMGGNYPQTLVNRAALDIASGRADVVAVTGAEAWRTRSAARKTADELAWTTQPDDVWPTEILGIDDPDLSSAHEIARGVFLPVQIYPMFDVALRAADGMTIDEHRERIAALWARASSVAAKNPHAWIQREFTAEQIMTATPDNRMVGFPYTKLMNSNNNVEQGAGVILCSVERARALGIPTDRWVFLHGATDAHDHWNVSERDSLAASPAIRIAGRRALELAGTEPDGLDHVDLYSCFPSAVQIAARELGLGLDRPLTVTGGMSFAGGPWNNYVTHSIATMAQVLREAPGSLGLVTANGGYLTKHAFGVYGTEPPVHGFRHEYCQEAVDRTPRRHEDADHTGEVEVESYTVSHGRDGEREAALFALRTPSGGRTWGRCSEPEVLESLEIEEGVGRTGTLDSDGTVHLS